MSLRLQNITKHFAGTLALDNVSFDVAPGQVHALLGENGAGKSTLMHIAYGMLPPDSGTIAVGEPGRADITLPAFASPRAARAAGLGMVHQHFTSIPALTVAENIALSAGWTETGRAAERRAEVVVQRLGLPLHVSEYAEALSVQLRQRLEIVKALAADATILLLDEPTAALAPREVAELLVFVDGFARNGGAVVLITHKLDEVFRIAHRVTVLRRGEVTLSVEIGGQTPQSLAGAMIGGDVPRSAPRRTNAGEVLVRAASLTLRGRTSGVHRDMITNANFDIRAGEIVGIAAIEGNGQRELLRAIAGVDDVVVGDGVLEVTGPVAFIPEDRTTEGLIPEFTLAENSLLGGADASTRWLDWKRIRIRTAELLSAYDVRAHGPDVRADTLSGGNQQKFILARALANGPRVIVAEDPTRGLDLQATHAVHDRLRAAAQHGAAVIVHASDLDEVLALSDRVLVVARGAVRELPRNAPREMVGDAMLALEPVG